MTLENWPTLLYQALNSSNSMVLTILYFFLWIFLGNYVLLNLFLAVLLDGFSIDADDIEDMYHDELYLKKDQLP